MRSSSDLQWWYWRPRALVASAATSVALVAAYWLYIFISVRDFSPVVLRRLLKWVVVVALYVPEAVVRGIGFRSYVYEAHDRMDTPIWYMSAAAVAVVSTLFYYGVWVAWRTGYRWLRSKRDVGSHQRS